MSEDDTLTYFPGPLKPIVRQLIDGDIDEAIEALGLRYLYGPEPLGRGGVEALLEEIDSCTAVPRTVVAQVRRQLLDRGSEYPIVRQMIVGDIDGAVETLRSRFLYGKPTGNNVGLSAFLNGLAPSAGISAEVLAAVRRGVEKRDSEFLPTLWHFTSARNVASIRLEGLLSLRSLTLKGMEPTHASSESSRLWDGEISHDEYVHLCLRDDHPMRWAAHYERDVQDIVWIQVDPAVVDQYPTLYSPTNAIKRDKPRQPDRNPRTALTGDPQAEVMVWDAVPVQFLTFSERV